MSSSDSKLIKLDFKAGIHRESTECAEEGSWYDVDRVRFRQGKPENLRGYVKKNTTTFDGTARDLNTWADNNTFKRAVNKSGLTFDPKYNWSFPSTQHPAISINYIH